MAGLSEWLGALKKLGGDGDGLSAASAAVKKLGVRDPKNPSAKDFKLILDAYLKDKSLNTEVFTTYVESLSAPLVAMFGGFAQFSTDSKDVSKRTIDVIERAMDVLQGELNRENISAEERQAVLDQVLRLVAEVRNESDNERTFRSSLARGVIGTVVIIIGVAVLVVTAGKYPGLMEKGLEIAGKSFAKSV